MSQFTKSSVIRCGFADITSLFLQTTVIAVDISITYQSAGDSLAKLWVAYRSHNTHNAEIPTTARRSHAPAKIEPRVYLA